ncbi:3-deoxy-7-phosphoheptulonate synthase [Legionella lytica]|uniref:Phospho-2-dehydro-3-deoxyheptonate aldolase n=1 Tax=Legionella lytica TaxID=96232 RepID=A0ABW8DAV3_9GAMM
MIESTQQIKNQKTRYYPFYDSINKRIDIESPAPLISIKEINKLRQLIARATRGEYFLIQLGNGSESICEYDQDTAFANLDFIHQLAEFFHRKTGNNVIQVSQISDHYTKHRDNSHNEILQNERISSYFGDKENQAHRKHRVSTHPQLLQNHNCSASVYREISLWNKDLSAEKKIYTSHKKLSSLPEQAITQLDKQTGLYYNRSTHFPLIDNTQHVDYLKKCANPLAIKIGSNTSIKGLIKTINKLDPDYNPGRITLIPCLGVQSIHSMLPHLIDAVKRSNHTVLWSGDPMQGNTELLSPQITVRKLSAIVEEIKNSFLIHQKMGSQLNAIHLEITDQDVTECLNYPSSIDESIIDRQKCYNNLVVNPRLNYAQAMHVMQCIAKLSA